MSSINLFINGKEHLVDVDPDTPLLWVLRDSLGLTGTKYSCGIGECGACTVHIEGKAVRSCILSVSAVEGKHITTIEGLSPNGEHPVQQAFIDEQVPQCGYCVPGQIMTIAALLEENPDPNDDDIDAALSNNLCRCGTYQRIRRAVHLAAKGGE
ncbi:MAG: (2Fe-2S)-binding protein [Anaerolineales bacterium]|jgi:aerobic-type carbon monoxide dehydrogenase small subunit (CoxS/CutS family)